jgi:hypothetical protein
MGCGASRSEVCGRPSEVREDRLAAVPAQTNAEKTSSSRNIGWLDVGLSCSPACKGQAIKNGAVDRNNDSKYVKATNKDRRRNGCPEILTVKELQAFALDLGFGTGDGDSVTELLKGFGLSYEGECGSSTEVNETLIQEAGSNERRASLPFSRSLGNAIPGASWMPEVRTHMHETRK